MNSSEKLPDNQPAARQSPLDVVATNSWFNHLTPQWATSVVTNLCETFTAPPSCWAFASGTRFRPPRHHRSFYIQDPEASGVVAIKGSEPLVADFTTLLDRVASEVSVSNSSEPHRAAEHFASLERKVPCAVTLDEALAEATKAWAVHRAHADAYGDLAHLPLPLAVLRLPSDTARATLNAVQTRISATAFEQVEPHSRNGLGVILSYYPGTPLRVTSLNHVLPSSPYVSRERALGQLVDPRRLMDEWSTILARLLLLGWLPTTPSSGRTGNMCQPQNAALDGGFFDVDSVERLESLPDEAAVHDALAAMSRSFYYTVRTLLVERSYYNVNGSDDIVERWILACVDTALRAALLREADGVASVHPLVSRYFQIELQFDDLLTNLSGYFPVAGLEDSRREARDFYEQNSWLLRL